MKFSKIVAIAFAALSIIGCDKSDDTPNENDKNNTGIYYKKLDWRVKGKTMGSGETNSLEVGRMDDENVICVLDACDFSS